MALASIIVPNYNGVRHFPALFDALSRQRYRNFEVILVDDASTDQSLQWLENIRQDFPAAIQIVRNTNNLGFAASCNRGIAAAQGEWIVLLNNDTQPEVGWLEALMQTVVAHPEIGMVASKMLFAHDPSIVNSAGIAMDWAGIAWDWRGGEIDDPTELETCEIFGPCGGAALYSRRMLDEIGGFDEDFFMYLEDVDLAWRAQLAGWKCLFQPLARVIHAHSASLGESSPRKSFLLGRNKIWTIVKNYPTPRLYRYLPIIIGYDLMATLYGALLRRNFALARGRLAALQGLRKMLVKRRAIQSHLQKNKDWQVTIFPVAPPLRVANRYSHLRPSRVNSQSTP